MTKIENVGWLMTKIAKEMSKQNRIDQFKNQYKFFDEIITFMQSVTDVEMKIKCKEVAWCLLRYGFCCNEVQD